MSSSHGYRFRLERVRALRERTEDAAKQELATAMARRQAAEAAVHQAEERLEQARTQGHAEITTATSLLAHQAYLERTEIAHRAQLQELGRHEAEVDERRVQLAAAARDRQVLERLKSKGLAAHQQEMLRQEGLLLDEIATQGSIRRAA